MTMTRLDANEKTCIVLAEVFWERLIRDDRFDGYVQDTTDNVWYLFKEVMDFEYEDNGLLTVPSHPDMGKVRWKLGIALTVEL